MTSQEAALAKSPGRAQCVVQGQLITLLRDGREAFPAMLWAIASARQQVLMEMYWFGSDNVGQRFAEALREAASRGVQVAVIYDAVGSLGVDPAQFEQLAGAGVKVLEYNPVAPWRQRFRLMPRLRRDHRKLLVVDGRVGFTGGINLGDSWAPEEDEGGGGWRDDMIRVEGSSAGAFADLFRVTWRRHDRRPIETLPRPAGAASGVRVLGEDFFRNQREIVRAYLQHIRRASRRVWIRNSYFVPDRRVLRALEAAARRGVDVRVLVPGVSDVGLVLHATHAIYGRLLRAGVRIFEWQNNVLHAKSAVIDGQWTTVGTFNLDHLSLRTNLEVNLSVEDPSFAALVEAGFATDFTLSGEVNERDHAFRPLGLRLLEWLMYLLRRFL